MAEANAYDLICVGAGLAGLVTALRGAELGLKVVLLEKGTGEHYPCNSRFTGGFLHVGYHDVRAAPEVLEKHVADIAVNANLGRASALDAERSFCWLRANGLRFAYLPPKPGSMKYGSWVMAPLRPLMTTIKDEAAWKGRGPDFGLRELLKRFKALGGDFFPGTRAQRLILQGPQNTQVHASAGDETQTFEGRSVVLCDGGFSGNPELFRRYIGPHPEKVIQRGAGTGRGDALLMATEVGAAVVEYSNRFYGHVLSIDALRNDRLWPYPQLDAIVGAGILVDRSGERIFDEGMGGIHAANCIAALEDPLCGTVIFDSAIWASAGKLGHVAPNPWIIKHGATVHIADTIDALARACGIPSDRLTATVNTYNDALKSRTLDKLSPARSEKKGRAMPIAQPPYMAAPACAGITHTMGGLSVDENARVLDASGRPLAGLYAAGASLGGLEGGAEVGYVGGLIKAAVFGLRAAEHAASTVRNNREAVGGQAA